MTTPANLILEAFFAIPREEIARDLATYKSAESTIRDEWERLCTIPPEQRNTAIGARTAHVGMLLAHAIAQTELPLELKIFNATFHANTIVHAVDIEALKKGKLSEIQTKMSEIRQREGLSPDEEWLLGEGPTDYQALDSEAMRISEAISDTMFVEVLRRYSLDEEAALFENDRQRFDILNDTARRVMALFDDMPIETLARMDQLFANEHGELALRQMRARVAKLKGLLEQRKNSALRE